MYDSHCKQQNFPTTIKPHKNPKTTSRKLKRIQRKNNTKQLYLCRDYTGKSKKRTKTLIFQTLGRARLCQQDLRRQQRRPRQQDPAPGTATDDRRGDKRSHEIPFISGLLFINSKSGIESKLADAAGLLHLPAFPPHPQHFFLFL